MRDSSRRGFLMGAAAAFIGGCAGGFYRGGNERVVRPATLLPEKEPPPPEPERPKDPIAISKKDPIYSGQGDDWQPNLTPIPHQVWTVGTPIRSRLAPMGRIEKITVHHEGAGTPNTHLRMEDVASDLRDIRKYHLKAMNAGDIGYHYIVDRAGRIWQGRSVRFRGAHAGGSANRANLGIMLLGNFDIQIPSDRQIKTLEAFLKLKMRQYRVPSYRLYTHRELKPTRCPGKYLHSQVLRFRTSI